MERALRRLGLLALVACTVALGGCFHPNIEDGGFSCDPTQVPSCPNGFFCVGGYCHSSPSGGGSGGGGGGGTAGGGGGGGGGGMSGDDMSSDDAADMSHKHSSPDLAMGGDNCAHDICTSGAKLANGCDACVTQICAQDSYCCVTKWSSQCVTEVGTICNQNCP